MRPSLDLRPLSEHKDPAEKKLRDKQKLKHSNGSSEKPREKRREEKVTSTQKVLRLKLSTFYFSKDTLHRFPTDPTVPRRKAQKGERKRICEVKCVVSDVKVTDVTLELLWIEDLLMFRRMSSLFAVEREAPLP